MADIYLRKVEGVVSNAVRVFRTASRLSQTSTKLISRQSAQLALETAEILRGVIKEYRARRLYSPNIEQDLQRFKTGLEELMNWCKGPTQH